MSYASDALIDAQRNTINRLKTENENLRRAAERDAAVMEGLVSYIDDSRVDGIYSENVELRELVKDMWICISHGSEGWDCTGCKRDPDSVCIGGISEFSQRMRELGIEVG